MKPDSEHEYTTYPRRLDSYKWYKPILVGLIFFILLAVFNLGLVDLITKLLFGAVDESTGYDNMDFFSAAGAFKNGIAAACVVPFMFIAALIVRDRPISSYLSSMGGWRWGVFLKTFAAAFVILGIPTIVMHLVEGRTGDIRFTIGGFILLTLLAPLQGFGEELSFRSYIVQTVSSWFMLPVAGIIVQMLIFTAIHPYNIVGRVEIAVSAILYAVICMYTKGLEAGSALHIINNMSEIYIVGIGFGAITAEQTVPSIAVNIFFKILFLAFIVLADKKFHWFDEVKYDDVEQFNSRLKVKR